MARKGMGFGTIVLAGVVVLLVAWLFDRSDKSNSKAVQLPPPVKAQTDAEAKRRTDLKTFVAGLQEVGVDESLIIRCECAGVVDHEIRIVVANVWHLRPHQVRLQWAQRLWQAWAKIHTPQDLDQSRIVLLDRNGNEIGGSRIRAGSTIWVKE